MGRLAAGCFAAAVLATEAFTTRLRAAVTALVATVAGLRAAVTGFRAAGIGVREAAFPVAVGFAFALFVTGFLAAGFLALAVAPRCSALPSALAVVGLRAGDRDATCPRAATFAAARFVLAAPYA